MEILKARMGYNFYAIAQVRRVIISNVISNHIRDVKNMQRSKAKVYLSVNRTATSCSLKIKRFMQEL